MNSSLDTIAALATPVGDAGIAIVRITGPQALPVGDKIFRPCGARHHKPSAAPTHTVQYGHVVSGDQIIDEVLVSIFRGPRTFTREDTVEVSCHGGTWVTRKILETVIAAGARLAEPGEFTRRAFLSGRLDLTQAEAVADIIQARTSEALGSAQQQLQGRLSVSIHGLRDKLLDALAHLEAHIDFPDEDIAPDTHQALLSRLEIALSGIHALRSTAREGRILRHGLQTTILGRPNAGKSSLLNLLLQHDRAIVSPIPGTTRDTVEELANIGGVPVAFTDTAGLRNTEDTVEREGIRRSEAAANRADLILHVVDSGVPWHPDDDAIASRWPAEKRLTILNKSDLPQRNCNPPKGIGEIIRVSCPTAEGFDALREAVVRRAWPTSSAGHHGEPKINDRHDEALQRAETALSRAANALKAHQPPELVSFDLRTATSAIGEIVGKTSTDDLLDRIFAQFCLGK